MIQNKVELMIFKEKSSLSACQKVTAHVPDDNSFKQEYCNNGKHYFC
jgi:hypothetical protein